ncbi:MAG: sugar phosphate nucleotidyltransferase [Verrucomicrobiota bacterium]
MRIARQAALVTTAFVLGAGFGTRLRPLTESEPKPLLPVFQVPLLTHAFDQLLRVGCQRFLVNTHHLADRFAHHFPEAHYRGRPLLFRHEPDILETGGGLANIRDLLPPEESIFVYNGDILATLPLAPALAAHQESDYLATLLLRSQGPARHLAYQEGRVTDIRGRVANRPGTHQFTGIYLVRPAFFDLLPDPPEKVSVIEAFLAALEDRRLGGVVIDEGAWLDLGTREALLEAHRQPPLAQLPPRIADEAAIAENVFLDDATWIGPHAQVGRGASLENCLLWPGAQVAAGARLRRCIVRSGKLAEGRQEDVDF